MPSGSSPSESESPATSWLAFSSASSWSVSSRSSRSLTYCHVQAEVNRLSFESIFIQRKLPCASGWRLVHQQRVIPRARLRVPTGASAFQQLHNSLLKPHS